MIIEHQINSLPKQCICAIPSTATYQIVVHTYVGCMQMLYNATRGAHMPVPNTVYTYIYEEIEALNRT